MQSIHGGDIYRNKVNMDFSVNINPLGIPKEVEAALHRAAKRCSQYPDPEAVKLKEAVADGLSVPKERLLFGNGASELFMAAAHTLRPAKILIPAPSFYGYEYAAKASGGEIVYFPLREEDGFALKEDFLDALSEDIDLLFLANPNNPTGRLIRRELLEKILQSCRDKNITVVLDECFIEFCPGGNCEGEASQSAPSQSALSQSDPSALSLTGKYDNLLVARAFTKIFAIPGVRLGYLVSGNAALLKKIESHLPEWNLSVFAEEAGVACARQQAYAVKTAEYVRREKQFLIKSLKELGLRVFPGEANFILIYSDKPLCERLLQKGILIRDCENFRGLSKGYYRIAVRSREDHEKLRKAIGECIE